ncbi:MAG: ABC transporter permease [Chloroflexi bacterium]|nr:ABC transporter permease [Chloroflexota bacterium]
MKKTLRVARLTLKEALSRRLIPAAIVVSVVYLILFAVAYNFAQERGTEAITGARSRALVGVAMASLALSSIYIVNLLSGVLALFLSVGAISSEVDNATLLALLARPMRRWQFLLGRWLAYAALIAVYVAVMAGMVMLIADVIGGYQATDPVSAIALMIMSALFLLTISLLGSTFLPTLTNGAVAFTLFGLGWLSGIIEVLGGVMGNDDMLNLGTSVAFFIPSDALWRSASYFVQPASILAASTALRGAMPILANAPPTPFLVAWGLVYPAMLLVGAMLVFSRRDL